MALLFLEGFDYYGPNTIKEKLISHKIVERNEKQFGMFRAQIHQIVCSCGWKSEWSMYMGAPQVEYDCHALNSTSRELTEPGIVPVSKTEATP